MNSWHKGRQLLLKGRNTPQQQRLHFIGISSIHQYSWTSVFRNHTQELKQVFTTYFVMDMFSYKVDGVSTDERCLYVALIFRGEQAWGLKQVSQHCTEPGVHSLLFSVPFYSQTLAPFSSPSSPQSSSNIYFFLNFIFFSVDFGMLHTLCCSLILN